jgi:uncharacterized phage protein gp47/JayE
MTLPTRDDLFNVAANEIIGRTQARNSGRQITPEQIYEPGSDVNLMLAGASVMGENVVRGAANSISNLTLDGASKDDLDRLVADKYSPALFRKQASPSRGTLTFTRSSYVAGAKDYDSGSIVQTTGGTKFEILQTASFSTTSLGPITVEARAVDAGLAGNITSANQITRPVTPFPDSTMQVTNTDVFTGGDDTETDASLRNRARRYYLEARRGVAPAIESGALTVGGVKQATAEEVVDSAGYVTHVNLYIADDNGLANAQLIELVRIALLEYRGVGVIVNIFGGTPVYISISLSLSYETNVNTLDAFEQVKETIVANVNILDPNKPLRISLISKSADSVDGVIVTDTSIVTPVGDVVPTAGQIIKTRKDLITAV